MDGVNVRAGRASTPSSSARAAKRAIDAIAGARAALDLARRGKLQDGLDGAAAQLANIETAVAELCRVFGVRPAP